MMTTKNVCRWLFAPLYEYFTVEYKSSSYVVLFFAVLHKCRLNFESELHVQYWVYSQSFLAICKIIRQNYKIRIFMHKWGFRKKYAWLTCTLYYIFSNGRNVFFFFNFITKYYKLNFHMQILNIIIKVGWYQQKLHHMTINCKQWLTKHAYTVFGWFHVNTLCRHASIKRKIKNGHTACRSLPTRQTWGMQLATKQCGTWATDVYNL